MHVSEKIEVIYLIYLSNISNKIMSLQYSKSSF